MNEKRKKYLSTTKKGMNAFQSRWYFMQRVGRVMINQRHASSSKQRNESKGHLLLLAIPVTSFCLGTWQVKRLEWKKGLIRELESRTSEAAVPLPSDILHPQKLKEMEYKRVTLKGRFDHKQEIVLGPRSLNVTGTNSGSVISRPKTGFHIVTPFILESGERILINRGWVPKEQKKPETRLAGQITDVVELCGYVRIGEKRPTFTPKANEDGFNWHYCDVDSFARLLNTSPLLVDADATSTIQGGPIGGQTRVNIRNEHMQYIITWFSLSAATLVMYYQLRKNPTSMFKSGPVHK